MTVLQNGNIGLGTIVPARRLSFPSVIEEKIQFYQSAAGEYGIGVYPYELRIHADQPASKISFGTQDIAGAFTELGKFQRNGPYSMSLFGSLWVNGTTYSSDERFKKNITSIQSPLQKLSQINGVEYEMRADEFPQFRF